MTRDPQASVEFKRWTRTLAVYLPDRLGRMRAKGRKMVALTAPPRKRGS